MTLTAIEVFQQAADHGLRLRAVGNDLHVNPGRSCPPAFVPMLCAHKPSLLCLLQLPFVIVDSKALGESVFFCDDDNTKAALIEAGADPWSVYTRDELRILVAHNRAKPFIPEELCRLHEIRKAFRGRIGTDNGG